MNRLKNEYYIAAPKEKNFQYYNGNELKKIHLFMNEIYHQILFGKKPIDNKLFHEFKKCESSWIASEKNHFLTHYDCNVDVKNESLVRDMLGFISEAFFTCFKPNEKIINPKNIPLEIE